MIDLNLYLFENIETKILGLQILDKPHKRHLGIIGINFDCSQNSNNESQQSVEAVMGELRINIKHLILKQQINQDSQFMIKVIEKNDDQIISTKSKKPFNNKIT
eukprot:TRINITY_DN22955_c0_g1_i1.p4 TRINITY_DN22955_c0_g1~~TRINITY_DN22955_c0_g1_i1.p4  ORF type:complete len:104 (+),score=21.30 TRINITY_DN22955_c0_g1_i1:250-561(+)